MPVDLTCPHCGAQTQVADRYVGETEPCAKCGRPVSISAPEPDSPLSGRSRWPTPPLAAWGLVILCLPAFLGLAIALTLPAVQAMRESARREKCVKNMKDYFGEACVLFADGHVDTISHDTDSAVLKALFTISGGEEVELPD